MDVWKCGRGGHSRSCHKDPERPPTEYPYILTRAKDTVRSDEYRVNSGLTGGGRQCRGAPRPHSGTEVDRVVEVQPPIPDTRWVDEKTGFLSVTTPETRRSKNTMTDNLPPVHPEEL